MQLEQRSCTPLQNAPRPFLPVYISSFIQLYTTPITTWKRIIGYYDTSTESIIIIIIVIIIIIIRHNNIARLVHWMLWCNYDLSRGEKWDDHQTDGVVENERFTILWDMTIQSKVDRLQIIVVAKNITVLQLFISRMPKICAIPQLVSASLNHKARPQTRIAYNTHGRMRDMSM